MARLCTSAVLALLLVVSATVGVAKADHLETSDSQDLEIVLYELEAAEIGEMGDTEFDESSSVTILDLPALDVDSDAEGRIRMDLPGLVLVGPSAPPAGCTPGYWKNHVQSWLLPGYLPGDALVDVFGPGAGSETLEGALSVRGGRGIEGARRILMRAAVASLLNSTHPDVSFAYSSPGTVIDAVGVAIQSANREAMLALAALFDEYNNAGCPLGR